MRRITTSLLAVAALALAPAASGTDGDRDGDRDGRHHHRHWGVLLLGDVTAVDSDNDLIRVRVSKATSGGKSLVGNNVIVKVSRLWVHDSNDDDRHNYADLSAGERILVKTKRRFIDYDDERISAAKVIDLPIRRWAHCSSGCDRD